ncbi:MAG: hypothetical protein JXX29_01905 [Deltaproteobacteria bacterium]|nr:hypothetical protein [Deltaproteobacteria bacterium]
MISIVLCVTQMTNALGFEYAFISGLYLSLAAGHLAAVHPSRVRKQLAPFPGATSTVLKLAAHSLAPAMLLLATSLVISLINTVFVPPCNTRIGLLFFLLIPLISVVMSVVCALTLGLLFRSRAAAVIGWYTLWFGAALWVGIQLYTTPAVFGYGPFIGYWPGVLYDKSIDIQLPLISYRVFNLVAAGLLLWGIHVSLDTAGLRLSLKKWFRTKRKFMPLLGGILFFVMDWGVSADMHHRISTKRLQAELPIHHSLNDADFYFDTQIPPEYRRNLMLDAAFSLYQLKHYFGVSKTPHINIFVFKDADQKKKWMGAQHTSVAKPWLGQTYIIADDFPHWTLRHELAHLVAAAFGRGPFSIAGSLGGWVPNPGLIEGIAVSATPVSGQTNLHQRAKGMQQLKLLPSLNQLFGISFFNFYSGSAYTAAGSFCRFFQRTYGAEALRELYSGRSIGEITNRPQDEVEKQWYDFLTTVPLSNAQLEQISYQFDRPSIVATRCVREVTRLEDVAADFAANKQWRLARKEIYAAHLVSGSSTQTHLSLLLASAACKDHPNTLHIASELLSANPGQFNSQHIEELLIDIDIRAQDTAHLADRYRTLYENVVGSDNRRRVYIKYYLANQYAARSKPLLKYLSHVPFEDTPEKLAAMADLEQLSNRYPTDPAPPYLQARMFFHEGIFFHAASTMKRALKHIRTLPIEFQLEAELTAAAAYARLGQTQPAIAHFEKVRSLAGDQLGTAELADDWIARINWNTANKQR